MNSYDFTDFYTVADIDESLIDSVSFGEQTTNIAYARIPNGTGDFVQQASTFNANNETSTSVQELVVASSFKAFPNPTRDKLTIEYQLKDATRVSFALYSVVGQRVANFEGPSGKQDKGEQRIELSTQQYQIAPGMYILSLITEQGSISRKVTILD